MLSLAVYNSEEGHKPPSDLSKEKTCQVAVKATSMYGAFLFITAGFRAEVSVDAGNSTDWVCGNSPRLFGQFKVIKTNPHTSLLQINTVFFSSNMKIKNHNFNLDILHGNSAVGNVLPTLP